MDEQSKHSLARRTLLNCQSPSRIAECCRKPEAGGNNLE